MTQLSFAFLCLCPSVTFLKWCHLLQPLWASNVSYESRNSCWPSRWALKGDHWSRVLERQKHGVETPRAALYLFTWLIMSFIQASFISFHLLVDIQPKPWGPTWSQVTKIAAIAFTTWRWALSVLTQRPIPLEQTHTSTHLWFQAVFMSIPTLENYYNWLLTHIFQFQNTNYWLLTCHAFRFRFFHSLRSLEGKDWIVGFPQRSSTGSC